MLMVDILLSPRRSRIYRHSSAVPVFALLGTGLATVAFGLIGHQLAGATPVPF